MIPKIIHYCWFGRGKKPKLVKKCIESWKKQCPDYEIIEWNEENFDVHQNPYLSWCYARHKWAFLSDLVRLLVVNEYGGIYSDTDVEMVAPFDTMLENEAFFSFENNEFVNTGLGFGANAGHEVVRAMIEQYNQLQPDSSGDISLIGCPHLNTEALIPFGLQQNGKKQIVAGALILPVEYMNPYDDSTGRLNKTENTLSIHWYSKSALSKIEIIRSVLTRPLHRWFGTDCFNRMGRNNK